MPVQRARLGPLGCLLLIGLVAPACAEDRRSDEHGPLLVAVLEASRFDAAVVQVLVEEGRRLTPADDVTKLPLFALLMVTRLSSDGGWTSHVRSLTNEPVTPQSLLALAPDAREVPRVGRPALLRRETTRLDYDVQGEEATGTVYFGAPGRLEGDVGFRAQRRKGSWEVVEFRLERPEVLRVIRNVNDTWALVQG